MRARFDSLAPPDKLVISAQCRGWHKPGHMTSGLPRLRFATIVALLAADVMEHSRDDETFERH